MYREGRAILTADGNAAKRTDHRLMRAIGKKTEFGVQAQHTSWLMHEYTTLQRLYADGAAVPKPIGSGENAILMSYQGDMLQAAPALSDVGLALDEAQTLFAVAMRNIELMLSFDIIHGDLSAYNILYWEGKITLIDFPQVSSVETNAHAAFILQRDITRTCEYFQRQGVVCDPTHIFDGLWQRYALSRVKPVDLVAE
jgi:RIO kinase 1